MCRNYYHPGSSSHRDTNGYSIPTTFADASDTSSTSIFASCRHVSWLTKRCWTDGRARLHRERLIAQPSSRSTSAEDVSLKEPGVVFEPPVLAKTISWRPPWRPAAMKKADTPEWDPEATFAMPGTDRRPVLPSEDSGMSLAMQGGKPSLSLMTTPEALTMLTPFSSPDAASFDSPIGLEEEGPEPQRELRVVNPCEPELTVSECGDPSEQGAILVATKAAELDRVQSKIELGELNVVSRSAAPSTPVHCNQQDEAVEQAEDNDSPSEEPNMQSAAEPTSEVCSSQGGQDVAHEPGSIAACNLPKDHGSDTEHGLTLCRTRTSHSLPAVPPVNIGSFSGSKGSTEAVLLSRRQQEIRRLIDASTRAPDQHVGLGIQYGCPAVVGQTRAQ